MVHAAMLPWRHQWGVAVVKTLPEVLGSNETRSDEAVCLRGRAPAGPPSWVHRRAGPLR